MLERWIRYHENLSLNPSNSKFWLRGWAPQLYLNPHYEVELDPDPPPCGAPC